ncbi:uncharacterized protein LOC115990416 [Quercus lobata]|uniref:uncharacterized protein LOC115990416 n=1 Tax=Quercus lobata TaxID=97700 RepID=UPI00124791B3|nr:uncharacterized protein LOC115990416 [Quercus lobata]
MQQFREVIDECGFMDLGFDGLKFTWSKHFEDGRSIWERLDRCLVTNSWFMRFVGLRVFHLTCMSSDHVPILISLSGLIPPVWKKLFRFKQMWLSNSSCEDVVFSAWGSGSGHGDGGDILRKVERCGKDLGHWEKNVFGNVKMELNRLKKVLAKEERVAMFSGNNFQVRQIKKDIEILQEREATMWAQRSRVQWANQGDKNSKYFHCCATKRFWKITLEEIRDEEGVWKTTKEDVGEVMVNYYKSLFTFIEGSVSASMLECVPTMIDEEMNAALCKEFEAWEVNSALQQMTPFKTPRLDGVILLWMSPCPELGEVWGVGEEWCRSEVLAALKAVTLTRDLGFQKAILEGDSLGLIKALKSTEDSLSPIGLLVDDVKRVASSFE